MTQRGLHADFIRLRPGAEPKAIEALTAAAAGLAGLSCVECVLVLDPDNGSPYDLIVLFFLESPTVIEPFGTDPLYTRFLQGAVAPVLQRLEGADLAIEGRPGGSAAFGACLCITAPVQTYDWEVRQRLSAWEGMASASWSVSGIAVGDRAHFRGLAFAAGQSRFKDSGVGQPSLEIRGTLRSLA